MSSGCHSGVQEPEILSKTVWHEGGIGLIDCQVSEIID